MGYGHIILMVIWAYGKRNWTLTRRSGEVGGFSRICLRIIFTAVIADFGRVAIPRRDWVQKPRVFPLGVFGRNEVSRM
jgi:hypothetical protein